MLPAAPTRREHSAPLICGVLAGPLFFVTFTVIGNARPGYEWRRHPVSSLANGRQGWLQRANFVLAGVLYFTAARGLRRRRSGGPGALPALVAGAGIGLIGSGIFVTDPVDGFPVGRDGRQSAEPASGAGGGSTPEGRLHNLCAIPIFAGIPAAGLASAASAIRSGDHRWAGYSAGSSLVMIASFLLFGSAFGEDSRLARHGGVFQRISIASGFGWLAALALRALASGPE